MDADLYEIIFKRKSIRKYDLNPLSENELAKILAYMNTLKPLDDHIKTEFRMVSRHDVKSMLPWKAPHYIAAFSEAADGYLTNIGFMLQQMDLFFSANDIGSCWQGWPKPTKEILNASKLEFVIVLAFGKAQETLHRASISEFKRKPLEQIKNMVWADELLEPVRLAPTTTQPWFFTGSKGIIHAYCSKSGPILAMTSDKYKKIEMGIGICHLWMAAKHFGKSFEAVKGEAVQDDVQKGYYHIISLKVV